MLDNEQQHPSRVEKFIESGILEPIVMAAGMAALIYALTMDGNSTSQNNGANPKKAVPNKQANFDPSR